MTPRWSQDGLKTGPRRVQERSKSHAFFVLIFESFWGRLGVVLGPMLGAKIDQKSFHQLTLDGLDFDLVIDWSQDGSKTVPRGLLGGSWAVLGGSWAALGGAALGPSWDGLGGHLGTIRSQDRKPVAPDRWSAGSRGRFWLPKLVPNRAQDDPQTSQKSRQKMHDF